MLYLSCINFLFNVLSFTYQVQVLIVQAHKHTQLQNKLLRLEFVPIILSWGESMGLRVRVSLHSLYISAWWHQFCGILQVYFWTFSSKFWFVNYHLRNSQQESPRCRDRNDSRFCDNSCWNCQQNIQCCRVQRFNDIQEYVWRP